jgi:DNA-binding transcriptional LysR family regulator
LIGAGWVLREEGSGTRSDFIRALCAMGLPTDQLDIRLVLPTNEAVRSAVMAGAGPGALSELVVADALASGALARVDLDLPRRAFHILRHSDRKMSRAADVFIKSLPGWPAECERPAPRTIERNFRVYSS